MKAETDLGIIVILVHGVCVLVTRLLCVGADDTMRDEPFVLVPKVNIKDVTKSNRRTYDI